VRHSCDTMCHGVRFVTAACNGLSRYRTSLVGLEAAETACQGASERNAGHRAYPPVVALQETSLGDVGAVVSPIGLYRRSQTQY
jgi:hypothetical protein